MEAILDFWEDTGNSNPIHLSEPALVLSNRPEARGLQRAQAKRIPTELVDHKTYPNRRLFEEALISRLESHHIDYIVLAGFMRVLSLFFVTRYQGRILNTHPSLLPAFPGKDAPQQAIAAGVTESGCTIHFVDECVDSGLLIAQSKVPVFETDDAEVLADRIREAEHLLYPRTIAKIVSGEFHVDEGIVHL
jgi:phosphoribosylglycinamide formyltransferase-1